MSGWRDVVYTGMKIANDYRAIRRGKVKRRIANRVLGRLSGQAIGRITRGL